MHRHVYIVGLLAAVALPLLSNAACNDDTGAACVKDTDCPPASICRNSVCGVPNPDGGVNGGIDYDGAVDLDANPNSSANGILCTLATECCSGQCTESHCSELGVPACKNPNELCTLDTDCCTGLTCKTVAGASSCQ